MRQRALAPQHFATELGFEGLDRAAQGRLSDVASLCCLGQIQSFADSQEISNLVHLQGTAPHYPFMAGSGNLTAAMVPSGANLIMLKCVRSEEHTSELQSLMRISYAVFCLKQNNNRVIYIINS